METRSHAESSLSQRVASEQRAAARGNIKRVRYTDELRRDVVRFVHVKRLSPEAVGRRLGLSKSVVRNWVLQLSRKEQDTGSRLQRVEVIASQPSFSESELRLVFPSGAHVAMSLSQLRVLLGGES